VADAINQAPASAASFSELFLNWWSDARRQPPGETAALLASQGFKPTANLRLPTATGHSRGQAAPVPSVPAAQPPVPAPPVLTPPPVRVFPTPEHAPRSAALERSIKLLGVPETPTYPASYSPPADAGFTPLPYGWRQPRSRADPFPAFFEPAPAPRATPTPGSVEAYGVRGSLADVATARSFAPLPAAPRPADASAAATRDAIVAEAKHAWDSYAAHCFGKDELIPPSKTCKNWMGAALQIIDALSTLHLMGLKDEFKRGRDWVAENLRFDKYAPHVSFFETTIRIVGGLLSAYDMTGDVMFLDKCVDVGYRLSSAFNVPNYSMPKGLVSLINGATSQHSWAPNAILSEIGTIQMEFFTLSALSGDNSFHTLADGVINELRASTTPVKGLYPLYVRLTPPVGYSTSRVTLGGLSDSFYEYLLKMWVLTGRTVDKYRTMYIESAEALIQHLYLESGGVGIVSEYPANSGGGDRESMEHLACFAGGMFIYGVHSNAVTDPAMRARHMHAGRKITEACVMSYFSTNSGLGAEAFTVSNSTGITTRDGQYHLRPEMVESVFYLWRATKDQKCRDWAKRVFEALKQSCRHENGYVGLTSVDRSSRGQAMETFLLAETFKYLFLIFSDDNALDIDTWVFNTEAHPVRARPWVQGEAPQVYLDKIRARNGNLTYAGPHKFTYPPLV
jgi:mannosyl-oligosaccharide alpha-1,2-mannosidase